MKTENLATKVVGVLTAAIVLHSTVYNVRKTLAEPVPTYPVPRVAQPAPPVSYVKQSMVASVVPKNVPYQQFYGLGAGLCAMFLLPAAVLYDERKRRSTAN